jgi:hypothetical protein
MKIGQVVLRYVFGRATSKILLNITALGAYGEVESSSDS